MERTVIGACLDSDKEILIGSCKSRKSVYSRVGNFSYWPKNKWQKFDGGVPFASIQGTLED